MTPASTSWPTSSDRPVNVTAAPSAASISTTPRPMPLVPPVTRATFPSSRPAMSSPSIVLVHVAKRNPRVSKRSDTRGDEMIRLAQLYTGGVGSEIVRRCAGHPELELVAVMVHADDKAGRDSGELVGAAANGIVTTQRLDDVIATKPDAAIHSGLTFDLDLITALLRAGVSVYTGIGGFYLPASPDFEVVDAAAREGNASFTAGGNIPGLISDVWPLFVTGYTGRIRQIRARQWNDVSTYPSAVQIQSLGIGKDVGAEAEYAEMFDAHFTGAIRQSAQMIADGLGVELTDCVLSEKR